MLFIDVSFWSQDEEERWRLFPYHGRGTKIAEQNMPAYMLLCLSVLWNATVRVSGRLQRREKRTLP